MPAQKRFGTDYPGVYFVEGKAVGTGKPERIYVIRYRRDGRLIEEKAGRQFQDAMTPARAANIRSERIQGKAPSNEEKREAVKAAKLADANRWTIGRLWETYKEQKTDYKSKRQDDYRYNRYFRLKFHDKEPADLAPLDVDRLRVGLTKAGAKPQTVKNTLALLKRIILFGVKKGLCPALPFRIELPKVNNIKTEFLTEDELERLFKALDEEPSIQGANILRMALFTAMRFGEICRLKWEDVDFERGFILLQDPKGGKDKRIPLNDLARKLLEDHPRTAGSLYVFPGTGGRMRVTNRHVAARVRDRAGLPKDFRYHHGLRHTTASYLANSGRVDSYIGRKLLSHEDEKMWRRYAHLADDTLRDASEVVTDIYKKFLDTGNKGKVVRIGKVET